MMHDSQKSRRLNASRGVDLGSFEVLVVVIVCEAQNGAAKERAFRAEVHAAVQPQ